MPVPTIKGTSSDGALYVARENPPRVGDLILMALPPDTPPPAGWTRTPKGDACYRYSDGTELRFPFPAIWYRPPSDEGTAV